MSQIISIRSPGVLQLRSGGTAPFYGGDQNWYRKFWQRMAGCGPTAAAHLLRYLACTQERCEALAPSDSDGREGFLRLMERSWRYVTPGLRGVNSTAMFLDGVLRYGQSAGIPLAGHTQEIPPGAQGDAAVWERYLTQALEADLPVAFLNLDKGRLSNLESWHWVTLVEYDPGDGKALMYDQGQSVWIDLALWARTTRAGGGFVAVHPAA